MLFKPRRRVLLRKALKNRQPRPMSREQFRQMVVQQALHDALQLGTLALWEPTDRH